MMKSYFENITTAEELKKAFHEWVKKLHPDNGGDIEQFKAMKAQYEKLASSKVWNTHKTQDGKTYEKANAQTPEEFADMIEKLRQFEGVTIEILGSWIWLTGNTKNYKDQLKDMMFHWSHKKEAWFYNGEEKASHRYKSKYSYNDLRNHWGVEYSETTKEKQKLETA